MPNGSSSSSTLPAADQYESGGSLGSSMTSDGLVLPGLYYKVEVPDFTVVATSSGSSSSSSSLHSYLRLGTVDPDTDVGEDLANRVALNDPGLHTLGGWRDHTDGNRIVTTRGDKVEVIGGDYRILVNAGRADAPAAVGDDPPWETPVEAGDPYDETDYTFVQHIFADTYYELIGTTDLLEFPSSTNAAASSNAAAVASSDAAAAAAAAAAGTPAPAVVYYAEPRILTGALSPGDLYEYMNAVNLTEIFAASANLTEKTYAQNAVFEVTSTVHAAYPDWESTNYGPATRPALLAAPAATPAGQALPLRAGDVIDYMFADNLTEVVRAEDLLIDRIYGGRLLEVIGTAHVNDFTKEVDPGSLATGDLVEYMNGKNVQSIMSADGDFIEYFESLGGNLSDTMQANAGKVSENFYAKDVAFNYTAAQSITESTSASTKTSTTTLTFGKSETTFAQTLTSVTTIAGLDLELKASGLTGDISLAILSLELQAAALHVGINVCRSEEIKKLQKSVYLMYNRLGLSSKSIYEQIDLGAGPP